MSAPETAATANTVYIVSDGTGETAATMVRAALVQYPGRDFHIVRYKNVRSEAQVDSVVEDAFARRAFVLYTLASQTLRARMREGTAGKGLVAFDLLGPLLDLLNIHLGLDSHKAEVGVLHRVNERYYKRVEAIEYTVKHDDGKELRQLAEADIVLVGISRTSKTPLSIFLSHKGWKVANVPLVLNQPLPEELFQVDQRKVVGLIIDIGPLQRIRKSRLEKIGQTLNSDYANQEHIHQEIEYAHSIFKKNRKWPVFNVTERALEETATEIVRVVSARLGLEEVIY